MINEVEDSYDQSSRESTVNIDFTINGRMSIQEQDATPVKMVDKQITDDEFKSRYDEYIRHERSTLVLKTSFHLINLVLMGLC